MDKPQYPFYRQASEPRKSKPYEQDELDDILFGLSMNFDSAGFTSRYPFPANNEHGLRQILTEDNRSRKLKHWPLVPVQDFKFYLTLTTNDMLGYNGNDAAQVKQYSGRLVRAHPEIPILDVITNGFKIGRLYQDFICLELILNKYRGKIVVAGGAVLRSILDVDKSDCDLFFYGISEQEATNILFDCITLIVAVAMKGRKVTEVTGEKLKIKVEHKLYVTNVILVGTQTNEIYQFIHRIYPTKDSIIGGFDLGPSMVLFDGEQIFSTPLGAYCIAKQCIIVDTSRRSISFEQRIYKLAKFGFNVIFPGINLDKSKSVFSDIKGTPTQEYRKIASLVKKLGFSIEMDYDNFGHEPHYSEVLQKYKMIDLGMIRFTGMTDEYELRYPRPLYATDEDLPKHLLKHYSDYGSSLKSVTLTHDSEIYINGAMLRTENLEGVSASITFPMDENWTTQAIFDSLIKLYSNPEIRYDVAAYKLLTYKFLMRRETRHQYSYYLFRNIKRETTKFAEFALKIRKLQDDNPDLAVDYTKSVVDYLAKRMVQNATFCRENLRGVKWMTQAVGVQWTSSINPIIENPRQYYGQYYTPFWIGMPCEIETTLRLFRRRRGNYFNLFPKDLFNLLLSYVSSAYIYNVSYYNNFEPSVQVAPNPIQRDRKSYTQLYVDNGGKLEDDDKPPIQTFDPPGYIDILPPVVFPPTNNPYRIQIPAALPHLPLPTINNVPPIPQNNNPLVFVPPTNNPYRIQIPAGMNFSPEEESEEESEEDEE